MKKLLFLFVIIASGSVGAVEKDFFSDVTQGLTAFFPMDEGQGNILKDVKGLAEPGILSNAIWVPGISGTALKFGDPEGYSFARIPDFDYAGLNLNHDFTICIWFKIDELKDETWYNLISQITWTGEYNQWGGPIYGEPTLVAKIAPYNTWIKKRGMIRQWAATEEEALKGFYGMTNYLSEMDIYNRLDDKIWHMYSFIVTPRGQVLNGTKCSLAIYIDGQLKKTASFITAGSVNPDNDIFLGVRSLRPKDQLKYRYQYSGLMDELRFYNRALTSSELKQLFQFYKNNLPMHQEFVTDFPLKINCGGDQVADFVKDKIWTGSNAFGYIDGQAQQDNTPIMGAQGLEKIYQSYRSDDFAYRIAIKESGTYTLTFLLAEFQKKTSQRVFQIFVEGKAVDSNRIDIAEMAGGLAKPVKLSANFELEKYQSPVDIEFVPIGSGRNIPFPIINGIIIDKK